MYAKVRHGPWQHSVEMSTQARATICPSTVLHGICMQTIDPVPPGWPGVNLGTVERILHKKRVESKVLQECISKPLFPTQCVSTKAHTLVHMNVDMIVGEHVYLPVFCCSFPFA